MARFRASPASPPSVKESLEEVGEELWDYLLRDGRLLLLSPEVVFEVREYETWVERIRGELEGGGSISVAQVRDTFGTSRKYALALMEHLDRIGLTLRDGDIRKLARPRD
jgi:selenocysteine-specific elongation factor